MTNLFAKPGYVYAMQPEGVEIVKVGATTSPLSRLYNMRLLAPQPMFFRHLIRVRTSRHAHIHENQILAWSQGCAHHGEWRTDLVLVDDLFSAIAPGEDARAEFPIVEQKSARCAARDLDVSELLCRVADAGAEIGGDYSFYREFRISATMLANMRTADDIPAGLMPRLEQFLQEAAA